MVKGTIEMGDIVKDDVTGFKGMAVARTDWLNGCVRWLIQPQELNKDKVPIEAQWVDSSQASLVKKGKPSTKPPTEGPPARGSEPKSPW